MQLSDLTPENLRRLLPLVERHAKLTAELAALEKDISSAVSGGEPRKEPRLPKKKVSQKPAKVPTQEKRSPRGSLKASILAVLAAAGPEGVAVPEIAAKLNVPAENIHAWFSTTGKKVVGLKKVSRGHWDYTDISNGGWA